MTIFGLINDHIYINIIKCRKTLCKRLLTFCLGFLVKHANYLNYCGLDDLSCPFKPFLVPFLVTFLYLFIWL